MKFDVNLSKSRYNLVNSLFDVMITYRLDELRSAMAAVYKAEAKLKKKDNKKARALIKEARALIAYGFPFLKLRLTMLNLTKSLRRKEKKLKILKKYAASVRLKSKLSGINL